MVKKKIKKEFVATMKADDRVAFDENDPEEFTQFEYLATQVEVLKETVEKLVDILRDNNIVRTETIVADYTDDDTVFNRLEERKVE